MLIQQGIHLIDLLQWWFGEPEAVSASTGPEPLAAGAVERDLMATMEFVPGIPCDLTLSTKPSRDSIMAVEVEGREGIARTDGETLWRHRGGLANALAALAARLRRHANASALLRRQCLDVLQAMRQGVPPQVTLTDGVCALRIVDALYRSAAQGRRIETTPQHHRGSTTASQRETVYQ